MNQSYRTVRNAAPTVCMAGAENARKGRGSKTSGFRLTTTAKASLALTALALGSGAHAVNIDVASEGELIAAIQTANGSSDPTSTITFTALFNITTPLPQIKANVTVDTAGRNTTIGSAGGASLEVQAGGSYQSASVQLGTTAGTSGSLIAQGSKATVNGTVLNTGPGQSSISVTDGATVAFGNNANLGGTNALSNGGITNVAVSGGDSTFTATAGIYHHNGTLTVSDGGVVQANIVQLGLTKGDVLTADVNGAGSSLAAIGGVLNVGAAGTATVTVGNGASVSASNFISLASASTGVGTLNIGAAVGDAPAAPGLVSGGSITGGSGKATVNFNHDSAAYEFAVPIAGTTTVNQVGSGTTILTGNNTYTGGTNIAAGTLQLGNGGNTGSIFGNVVNNGVLAINHKNAFGFASSISGSGAVEQLGSGATTLTGTNTYTGGTTVQAGQLIAGSAGAFVQNSAYVVNGGTLNLGNWDLQTSSFSGTGGTVALGARTLIADQNTDSSYAGAITGTGSFVKSGTAVLTLSGASSYSGPTVVAQGTLRAGAAAAFSQASAATVATGATLDLAGFNQTLAAVNNSGTVNLTGATPGTTLTVTGPWVGNGGTLRLGTALGTSASTTDRLVLSGATAIASGTTNVQVTNLGGLGALTTGNGIELISAIGGATTTAQTTKNAFALAGGHVDAGAYEYRLYAADASGAGENWYLRSSIPVVPPTGGGETSAGTGSSSGSAAAAVVPTYRAEVPLYAAQPEQLRQANLSMLGNAHLRAGDDGASGASTASSAEGRRQAWGRVISIDRTISQAGTVNPTSKGRLSGFQAGTDLWADANWRAGVYVGQLDGDMRVTGFASGIQNLAVGSNDMRNQYFGVYGSWKNDGGLYVDGVLQSGRHRYDVAPAFGLGSSGKGNSLLASIEVGQALRVAPNWVVEPQLQLVHQRISLDDTTIPGATVQQNAHNGWLARAGVRVKGEIATGAGLLQPYVRVNVYRTGGGTDIARFIGPAAFTDIVTRTGGTSSELAAGATWAVTPAVSLYGELGKLWASSGGARNKSGVDGSLGVKVHW